MVVELGTGARWEAAGEPRGRVRAGYVAFAWALLFAAAHVSWALGGSWLVTEAMVDDGRAQWARDPWRYAIGWTILTLLFVGAGLFPLALAWPGGRIGRRRMERFAVAAGYGTMLSLAGFGLATGEAALAVLGGGAGAAGGVVARLRPRGERGSRWLVLVATWILGAAMVCYGAAYLGVLLLGEVEAANVPTYLVAGGLSWSAGGLLFVATACRSRRTAVRDDD